MIKGCSRDDPGMFKLMKDVKLMMDVKPTTDVDVCQESVSAY